MKLKTTIKKRGSGRPDVCVVTKRYPKAKLEAGAGSYVTDAFEIAEGIDETRVQLAAASQDQGSSNHFLVAGFLAEGLAFEEIAERTQYLRGKASLQKLLQMRASWCTAGHVLLRDCCHCQAVLAEAEEEDAQ